MAYYDYVKCDLDKATSEVGFEKKYLLKGLTFQTNHNLICYPTY